MRLSSATRYTTYSQHPLTGVLVDVLVVSAMTMVTAGDAPLADFQDTVRPSEDTESVPSCFLYCAAASDMSTCSRG